MNYTLNWYASYDLCFIQCFDTVGLVIWPVEIILKMTYYVSSGTLNPTHSLTLITFSQEMERALSLPA